VINQRTGEMLIAEVFVLSKMFVKRTDGLRGEPSITPFFMPNILKAFIIMAIGLCACFYSLYFIIL